MTIGRVVPGSFRDPGGRVYDVDGRIVRTVANYFSVDFEFVESTGLFQKLAAQKRLIPFQKIDAPILSGVASDFKYLLEVPRLPFISYPYEWSFSALKAAALLHIEIHLAALEHGATLSDASAYNIQFHGVRPVFIDHLSFRRYHPGDIWVGHRQFCEQFLNPLLLRALFGIPHNAWYRGTQEGIETQELSRLLKWRHLLSWTLLTQVVLQAVFQRSVETNVVDLKRESMPAAALPLPSLRRMLQKLRSWISKLHPAGAGKTIWQDYTVTQSYSAAEAQTKRQFVIDFVQKAKPRTVWDLGCNTGDYCVAALEAGAEYAVGFDSDQGALESAFARSRDNNLPFQALFFDAANPSPNQGWNEQERSGLRARASADAVLALAFVHHLAIGRNIPLEDLLDWIIHLAPSGVIEFVPKGDPMVQVLLRHREDIFPDYTQEGFLNLLEHKASITHTAVVSASGRLLAAYKRRAVAEPL